MDQCQICGKSFKKRISLERHITSSYGKEKGKKHCPILVYRHVYEKDERFSKDSLRKMYVNDRKSTPMISDILMVNKKTLLDTMHFYGIQLRNVSEAAVNQIGRDGLWNKGLTKKDHPGIMSYAKKRVGKNNPYYTAPGFEERHRKQIENGKKGIRIFCANRNPKTTERRMASILDSNNFFYIRNFSLSYYENGKTKWRLFDFLVNNKLLIEMNGNYFHANPDMYKESDVIQIANKYITAKDIWEYDNKKIELGKKSGYEVLVFWEKEFINMRDEEVINLIRKEIL
jgi:hypothetical protein